MKTIRAEVTMSDKQYHIFETLCMIRNKGEQEYVGNAVINMMGADIDSEFKSDDPRRNEYFDAIGWLKVSA